MLRIAPRYSIKQILYVLILYTPKQSPDGLNSGPVATGVVAFIAGLQQADGSFASDAWGEAPAGSWMAGFSVPSFKFAGA